MQGEPKFTPDLACQMFRALQLAEKADNKHSNCDDCMENAQAPEVCERCFPSADKARVARRDVLHQIKKHNAALLKATGGCDV